MNERNMREIENALIHIADQGPEWLEWCGAMYESYASDREWCEGTTYYSGTDMIQYGRALHSLDRYGRAAHRLAEDLENKVYEDQQNKIEFAEYCQDQQDEYDLAWGCWQEQIYDPDR